MPGRMARARTKTIKTDYLARVEGEGAMIVRIAGGEVEDVKLNIYEPPRFFEAFLRGRAFTEAPDITARICGICPVAYQMSSCAAMEQACGVEVGGQLRGAAPAPLLRRVDREPRAARLHAPPARLPRLRERDRAGARQPGSSGAGARAEEDRQRVDGARRRARGAPDQRPRRRLVPGAAQARAARRSSRSSSGRGRSRSRRCASPRASTSPTTSRTTSSSRCDEPGEYPIDRGRIVSNRGLDIAVAEYDEHFVEEHVEWSNALHSQLRGARLLPLRAAGALRARLRPALAARAARPPRRPGSTAGERNPFRSIVVRSVELVYAADEALRLIADYEEPDAPGVEVEPRAGIGYGCTEAPRGILYHRYELDDDGTILDAKIVPPTSQNQRAIEEDLRGVVERSLDVPDDELALLCEQTIRNYDPCISCATHFLQLEVDAREGDRGRQRLAERRRRRARRRSAARGYAARGRRGAGARGRADLADRRLGGRRGSLARRRRVLWRASPDGAPPRRERRASSRAELFDTSTHHFGLAEAVELARALGRLPRH